MKVRVKFFTTLKEITGKGEEVIKLSSEVNIGEFLDILLKRYGPELAEYVFKDGDISPYLIVLIDGKKPHQGLKTPLKDGATIALLPPIGGGCQKI